MNKNITKQEIIDRVEALGNDAFLWDMNDYLEVTFHDYEGIDEYGDEIGRDYDNPEAVDDFIEFITQNGDDMSNSSIYDLYRFNGFQVELGYASYDI